VLFRSWVEPAQFRDPTSDAMIAAFKSIGVPENHNFNGPDQWGVGYFDANIKRGKRWSAAMAYLREAEKRANVTIITEAHTTKICCEGKRATGVEYNCKGATHIAKAKREVVLSAGAYHSPQILQLSGIGPSAHLKALGIDVLADRWEVGSNLQDHIIPPLAWRVKPGVYSQNDELRGSKAVWNFMRYLLQKKGPMTNPAAPVGAFVKSDPALDRPDIQFHCLPLTGDLEIAARGEKSQLNQHPGFTLGPYFLRPESRGTAMAASANPYDTPAITHNYLDAAYDRQVTLKAVKIARSVAATPELLPLIQEETDPGIEVQSDDELLAFARQYGMTGFHPAGTCRMGMDEHAVVDPQLKVKGAEGLRVVDASIMPRLISGNTHAATIMIAEKASDMIKSDQ